MSEIKYVTPSGLAHYDEKIKEVIGEVDTSTNTKVTQTPTSSNETYPLLLSPTGQTSEVNTTSYFNSDVVLNPSTKTISANIDGNAETATKAVQDGDGNTITTTYVKETPEFTESTERNNIESKESMSTILGKVKKYFTDLKSHAFNALANNLTTTTEGYALDATQGKALQDKIGSTDISAIGDGTATGAISSLNSNLSLKPSYITFPSNIDRMYVIFILADVTEWFNCVSNHRIYFSGNIFAARYGISISDTIEVNAALTYQNNGNLATRNLCSSSDQFVPCILKYTTDDTVSYKLALKFNNSFGNYGITFLGFTSGISEIEAVHYPTSQDLPDGYEMAIKGTCSVKNNMLVLGVGNTSGYYTYDNIKSLADRITALENN